MLDINNVYLGDCLEVMEKIDDKSIDMIFCDLPFGSTNCKWDSPIDLVELWKQYKRISKNNTPILLFAQTPFDKVLGCSNLDWLRYEWIWEKTQATGHLNAKKAPMKAHENILCFYDKEPTYNPQKTHGHKRKVATAHHKRNCTTGEIYNKCDDFKDYDSTERFPRSVQIFKSDKQKLNLHPTQKPLALCEYLIKTYSNEGDLILDNCAGSGTSLLAAKNLNRKFIGIEQEEKYFEISKTRLL